MADKKISDFAFVTALAAVDTIPVVQAGANKQATLGQFNAFLALPTVTTVVSGAIPQTSGVAKVSGDCTLESGTVEGKELTIVASGVGKVISIGLLPQDGFTFTAGSTLKVIWCNGTWNLISSAGMTAGIV